MKTIDFKIEKNIIEALVSNLVSRGFNEKQAKLISLSLTDGFVMYRNLLASKTKDIQEIYHPSHLGEAGGRCVTCAVIDAILELLE